MDTWYGSKYEETKDLDIKDIAKLVRGDIKAAVKTGALSDLLRYGVRIERFSGGQSIDVRIAWKQPPEDAERRLHEHARANCWLETLKGIVDAYNFDGSDMQSDYFRVRFYSHIGLA